MKAKITINTTAISKSLLSAMESQARARKILVEHQQKIESKLTK